MSERHWFTHQHVPAVPPSFLRRSPWVFPGVFLGCHALFPQLVPDQRAIVSLGFLVLASLFAARACVLRARAGGAEGWRILAVALVLWSAGMASNALVHLALGYYLAQVSLCMLFFVLYGVPIIFAAASPANESGPVRLVDAALAVALGLLFFVHTVTLSTMAGASLIDAKHLTQMFDIENSLTALFAFIRFCASGDSRERNFFGSLTIYAFIYFAVSTYIDHEQANIDYGTLIDLLIDIPFLVLMFMATRPIGPKEESRIILPRRERFVQAVSPLMLSTMLLVVAATMLHSHPAWAVAGFAMATLVYGLRNVLTHLRNLDEQDRLQRLSQIDGLTGLPNRRIFDETLQREWSQARRAGYGVSLLMIDIDHFKLLNDHLGHPEGDRRLRDVARALAFCATRSCDLVARYGGEEFVVILPSINVEQAVRLAEIMRISVHNLALPSPAPGGRVSISIGVSSAETASGDAPQSLLSSADAALYEAKRDGRNTVRTRLAA